MGIRRTIGRIGVGSAAFSVAHSLRLRARSELRLLAYQRVMDPAHAYDSENVSAKLENFDWQMRYMRSKYDLISFAELSSALANGDQLPSRCAMITFDGGFADNYFNAFPVLKELGIPALFNLVTSMVGQRSMYWFDRAACLVKRAPDGYELRFDDFALLLDQGNRESATARLLRFLKDQPDQLRCAYLASIDEQLAPLMPCETELAPHYPLNWEQVRLMSDAGMEFGSHTHSHPILSKLADSAAIDHELLTSRHLIEQHTAKACLAIAYPEGLDDAIDQRVVESAEKTGYKFGLCSLRGVNSLPLELRYALERIQIHHSDDKTLFKASVQFPELAL